MLAEAAVQRQSSELQINDRSVTAGGRRHVRGRTYAGRKGRLRKAMPCGEEGIRIGALPVRTALEQARTVGRQVALADAFRRRLSRRARHSFAERGSPSLGCPNTSPLSGMGLSLLAQESSSRGRRPALRSSWERAPASSRNLWPVRDMPAIARPAEGGRAATDGRRRPLRSPVAAGLVVRTDRDRACGLRRCRSCQWSPVRWLLFGTARR